MLTVVNNYLGEEGVRIHEYIIFLKLKKQAILISVQKTVNPIFDLTNSSIFKFS